MGPDSTPEDIGHLRGVRVAEVDPGRVIRVIALVIVLALAVAAVILAFSAARDNARLSKLQDHGVSVEATVTGCSAISSGVGMGTEYWECRGTYSLDGHHYNQVIRGSRAHLNPGQTVQAVAVPGDPSLLSTVAAAAHRHSAWPAYLGPIILGAVAVIIGLGVVLWWRRHPGRAPAS
jgi:hypothetical protein